MKKVFYGLLLLVSLMLVDSLRAAVVVSYHTPDIIAPGMNVYMEIIGPFNVNGNFGADGTYLNNSGDNLRLECVNPADNAKLTFGPLVVGWQGRMVATQVFANPYLEPNSWEWDKLRPEFVVAVQIRKNGTDVSNPFNIYIANPFPAFDLRANTERILGEGSLGKRSPRGAMIVDSLFLANGTYFVSSADCDPATIGNQAYLPFHLIARYNIYGGSASLISVDGGRVRYQNAGPGGGGGGGRFYDAGFLCSNGDNGDDGGDGFTGGGAGGRNRNGFGDNALKKQGNGTYEFGSALGYSLNLVPPSITPNIYESAGGGTGHPFGASGIGCYDGNNCEPLGQLGGASGVKQNTAGGSGGYATDGEGANGSGGKTHGNKMLIPLAGGSGGAGGNPQFGLGCNFSGSGGGGGGAVVVAGNRIESVKVSALGSTGQNGIGSANGGGGSGGAIITSAKIAYNNGSDPSVFVAGGKAGGGTNQYGGWGRVRHDAPVWNVNIGTIPVDKSYFRGPSSDTTKFVKPNKNISIKGSKNSSEEIRCLLKSQSGDWTDVGTVAAGSSFWEINLNLSDVEPLYYFVAMQKVTNPKEDASSDEPEYVMSQAAANILILEDFPHISGDSILVDTLLACEGQQKLFKAKIYNLGKADLILNSASFTKGQMSLVSPINNRVVAPLDSTEIEVLYSYNPVHGSIIVDSLLIIHNDVFYDRPNPWRIHFEIRVEALAVQTNLKSVVANEKLIVLNEQNVKSYMYNLCLGDSVTFNFSIKNNSKVPLTLEQIVQASPLLSLTLPADRIVIPNGTIDYSVKYKALTKTNINSMLRYKFDECDNYLDSLLLRIFVVEADLAYIDTGVFPETRVGQYNDKTIRIKNNGTTKVTIVSIVNPGNGFSVLSTNPTLPASIAPAGELAINVRFAPIVSGDPITAVLRVEAVKTDSTCADFQELTLSGKAVESSVILSKYNINFDTLYTCTAAFDTVYVINPATSTTNVTINKPSEIIGSPAFSIVYQDANPKVLAPGDSSRIVIEFLTGTSWDESAQLVVYTDEPSNPQIFAQLRGVRDEFDIEVVPSPVDLGDVNFGAVYSETIRITNNGILPLTMTDISFDDPSVAGTFNPNTGIILPNGGYMDVLLDVTITNELNEIERYSIDFAECSRSSTQIVEHNKLFAEITTNSPLDFGILSGCEDSLMYANITNIGDAPAYLKSRSITGADFSLFSINGENISLPDSLRPGITYTLVIKFDPQATTNSIKNAKLMVEANVNGVDQSIEVGLTGEKRSAVITNPSEIVFGNVVIGTQQTKKLNITNAGFFDVEILSIQFPTLYGTNISVSPDHTGADLPAGTGAVEFDIVFSPIVLGSFADTLFLNLFYNGCYETVAIAISGTSIPARKIIFDLPEISLADPRTKNLEIPIYAKVDLDTLQNFVIDTLEMTWERSLFFPYSVEGAEILYNNVIGTQRVLGVRFPNLSISDTSKYVKVSFIKGDVLLGATDTTDLKINKVVHSDFIRVSEITHTDGGLSIVTCNEGDQRLLNVVNNPINIVVAPNPVSANATLDIAYIEAGDYSLEIYDVLGNRIGLLSHWQELINGDRRKTLSLDFSTYSTGVYMLRLTTPTEYYQKIMAISK